MTAALDGIDADIPASPCANTDSAPCHRHRSMAQDRPQPGLDQSGARVPHRWRPTSYAAITDPENLLLELLQSAFRGQ